MIFETKIFIKWFFLLTKIMLWKFFRNHQKYHAIIENHVMEIHVRRDLAVPNGCGEVEVRMSLIILHDIASHNLVCKWISMRNCVLKMPQTVTCFCEPCKNTWREQLLGCQIILLPVCNCTTKIKEEFFKKIRVCGIFKT